MKKLIAMLLALTLILTLSACGAGSGNTTETPTTQDELVDYIEQRDLESFEKLMRKHIERSKETCLMALKESKLKKE